MKHLILLLAFAALIGCSTTRHASAMRVVRQADPALARERTVGGFEGRLDQLGAKIEAGVNPGDKRVASFPTPAAGGDQSTTARPLPGYFPPRIVTIVYVVTDDGLIELESARVISLGNRLAKDD